MQPPKGKRRTYLLIIHGARAEEPGLRQAVARARERGCVVEPRVTWECGDALRFAQEGAARSVDAVIAVGGDGTVNEVINGLDGSDVPLGIIPLGTANDFARQAAIPTDPEAAMELVLQRPPVLIDTAELNGRRYLNVSTGGIGAEATAETPPEAKEALGLLAYAITGVKKMSALSASHAHFAGDGFSLRCEFLLFAVGNTRRTGGGTPLVPRASVTDGLLDVCIVESMPLAAFALLVLKLRKGEHIGEEGVHYAQLPSLTVTASTDLSTNVDGEAANGAVLAYRARPRDLWVHVPRLPDEQEL